MIEPKKFIFGFLLVEVAALTFYKSRYDTIRLPVLVHPHVTTSSNNLNLNKASNRKWIHQLFRSYLNVVPQSHESTPINTEQFDRNGQQTNHEVAIQDNLIDIDLNLNPQQLWLDIRGTALSPNEAIQFIQDQCFKTLTSKSLIDAVVVTSTIFEKVISSSQITSKPFAYQLLYTTDNNDEIFIHLEETQQSLKIGKVVRCVEKENLDLIASYEFMIDQQQWLILQGGGTSTDNKSYSPQSSLPTSPWMLKQVTELLRFLLSSASGLGNDDAFHESTSGLFLPSTKPQRNTDSSPPLSIGPKDLTSCGGVAIVCSDRTSFVNLDTIIAEFRSTEYIGPMTTTNSGLQVPSSLDNDSTNSNSFWHKPFITAIILPLDVSIWQTVYDIRCMENDNEQQQ
jgi:hypothetical protein